MMRVGDCLRRVLVKSQNVAVSAMRREKKRNKPGGVPRRDRDLSGKTLVVRQGARGGGAGR